MRPRLREFYRQEAVPALMGEFGYKNVMQVPRPTKVCLNMGVEGAREDRKLLDNAAQQMAMVAGQRPAITRASKSVANFRIRQGMAIGCRLTLRGDRMYEFLDRLFSIALPRIRDFRGLLPRAFDGRGSYSLGIVDLTIFPELHYDEIDRTRGMDITIVTSAATDEEARALLTRLGLPLRTAV